MFVGPRERVVKEQRDADGRIIRPLSPPPALRRHIESTIATVNEQWPDTKAIQKRLAEAGIVGNDFVRQLLEIRRRERQTL